MASVAVCLPAGQRAWPGASAASVDNEYLATEFRWIPRVADHLRSFRVTQRRGPVCGCVTAHLVLNQVLRAVHRGPHSASGHFVVGRDLGLYYPDALPAVKFPGDLVASRELRHDLRSLVGRDRRAKRRTQPSRPAPRPADSVFEQRRCSTCAFIKNDAGLAAYVRRTPDIINRTPVERQNDVPAMPRRPA